ncbi:MAG: iron-containing alcohol dehydrogenase [Verrucomicrobia bacterium]|nr:iron-containing alcohol dehydrogenase [Verrucomicrobiota bacterium]MDA1068446.1 iron-containing alcohol dehydrogenase [Verrucomicrobiota bacterium]
MEKDYAFEMATSSIRFGAGITAEIGMDLADAGYKKALVLTDQLLAKLPPVLTVLQSLEDNRIDFQVYDRVRIEPNEHSFMDAIRFGESVDFDCIVAVGGGSVIDTAKAVNLYTTYPADLLDYVNAPIGKAKPVPGPLKPLYAIPTTCGTGSETTGVTIFDLSSIHAKTGIAHRRLKPTLGLIDPENTRTMPPVVVASTGLDVLSHAIESYTAIDYRERPKPDRPILRPAYQGSNPLSDIWSLEALRMVDKYLIRAFEDSDDIESRGMMHLAAGMAGVGFGNAGVHLPHGMSYPVSSHVREFIPEGFEADHAIIPHGMSVILNAPAVFRFTASANPGRHRQAAEALGANVSGVSDNQIGEVLANRIIEFMQRLKMPNGLSAVGYTSADIPTLVQGTLPQHRVTKLSPLPADESVLSRLFEDALNYW